MNGHVVILGAGHAGGAAAALLRQYGHTGQLTLIGEEPLAPYQRPPLSKAWLKGEADAESLALRPAAFYGDRAIDFRPSTRAAAIARETQRVSLSDGSSLAYDALIVATGASAVRLAVPGADLAGVLVLRSASDAEALKNALGPGRRLAVVGGGYIGLEVAASGRALGAHPVVLEREPRLLARVSCSVVSDFLQSYHEARGVAFELGCEVVGFEGEAGAVRAVVLADGRKVECDVVVVGVGARPNDDLARDAGLACARGAVVDLDSRSVSDPRVFAIGDVAYRPLPVYNRMFRLESVPNALEQAKQAASALTHRARPEGDCPWQWSDQYDLKLQIAGYPFDCDEVIVRGDPPTAKFAVFHLRAGRVQCVEAINAPGEFLAGKGLILRQSFADRAKLADLSVSMKTVEA